MMMKPASIAAATCSAYQSYISSLAKPIQEHVRVLRPQRGSGNYGESGMSAFYTIDSLPTPLLELKPQPEQQPELKRVDIDLGHQLAFYIDNILTHNEADALAACAEAVLEENGHSRLAPGIQTPPGMRVNEAAHWYPTHGSPFLPSLFQRFQHLVPPTIDNKGSLQTLPLYQKLSEKIAQFKYEKGDKFNRHVDGLFQGQGANPQGNGVDEWTGVVSGMSMLFFLNDKENDGLEGGATRLWSSNGSSVDIIPKKGRVLFFRRGSPDAVMHAGLEVTGDVPKYMALINLAYGEQSGTRPM